MEQVRAKKHLGQHFLRDEGIASKIVDALHADAASAVIEVGPGTGVLTKYLLEREMAEFLAFDVDRDSITYLQHHFHEKSHHFILQDFLDYDLQDLTQPVKVIGNFPYNISSQLFFKIWEHKNQVSEVVCMVQKEVAERIASKEGNKVYGILSVLLQTYFKIEYLFTVPPHVFQPPPKVQSGVIRLTRNEVGSIGCDDAFFKKMVKAAFGKRRKTLRNALKDLNLPSTDFSEPVFDLRAEQLSVQQLINLAIKIAP